METEGSAAERPGEHGPAMGRPAEGKSTTQRPGSGRLAPPNQADPFLDPHTLTRVIDAVVRRSAVALVVTDLEHRIRIWSAGAEGLLGYTAPEIEGKSHRTIIPNDLFETDESELRHRVIDGEEVFFFPTERLAKDGQRIPVEVCRSTVRDERGKPLGYSSTILDLREKRTIQDRLIQAERQTALVRVVGKVFHELRTPLGVLVLQTELLSEEIDQFVQSAGNQVDEELIGRIRSTLGFFSREIRRIENLGEDYLLMIRPIRAHRTVQRLGEFLQMVNEELVSTSGRPGFELRIRCEKKQETVSLDPFQMLRVFHNLAANSLDAIPQATVPLLTLDASFEGDQLVMKFRDNGPGLPSELQSGAAFEIFTTTKSLGSGLGLHLVQEIIGAHGGSIELRNHPDGGAEAVIRLPKEIGPLHA